MFKKLGSMFKKLWNAIRKVLAIILIIIAVILICFFTFGSGLLIIPFLGIALTPTMALLAGILALTCAFVIDGDTSSEVVGKVGEALGDAAKAVGSATGSVVGGGISGILSSPVMTWGLIAVGAYFLLGSGGKSKKEPKPSKRTAVAKAPTVTPIPAPAKKGSEVKAIKPLPTKPTGRPSNGTNDLSRLLTV